MSKEKTITVFSVTELDEHAKNHAYYNWLSGLGDGWHSENVESMRKFEAVFPIVVMNYSYDRYNGYFHMHFQEDTEIESLSGVRLATYIYNNYWHSITKGRWYHLHSEVEKNENGMFGKLKSRYSKVFVESYGSCPFNGYYMDDVLLTPIYDFLKKPDQNENFGDLMKTCLNEWIKACVDEEKHAQSMKRFEEEAIENDWEYLEDGTQF